MEKYFFFYRMVNARLEKGSTCLVGIENRGDQGRIKEDAAKYEYLLSISRYHSSHRYRDKSTGYLQLTPTVCLQVCTMYLELCTSKLSVL